MWWLVWAGVFTVVACVVAGCANKLYFTTHKSARSNHSATATDAAAAADDQSRFAVGVWNDDSYRQRLMQTRVVGQWRIELWSAQPIASSARANGTSELYRKLYPPSNAAPEFVRSLQSLPPLRISTGSGSGSAMRLADPPLSSGGSGGGGAIKSTEVEAATRTDRSNEFCFIIEESKTVGTGGAVWNPVRRTLLYTQRHSLMHLICEYVVGCCGVLSHTQFVICGLLRPHPHELQRMTQPLIRSFHSRPITFAVGGYWNWVLVWDVSVCCCHILEWIDCG